MRIDMPTLAVMTALAYLALPLLTWLALRARRDLTVDLWCGGGLLASVGFFLSSLRGQLSDWLTLAVGFAFLIGSMVARAQALRISLAMPDRARQMVALAALSSLAFCLAQWLDAHFLRGMIVRVSVCLAAAGLSWLAWQLSRKESSPAAGWIAITYALMSLGFLALVIQSALAADAPRASGWSSYWTVPLISSMITAVVGHFGFAASVFEREKRAEVERSRRRAHQDESRQLESRLRQLNRQRDLAVVASSLGHELSQPLAVIRVHAEVARRGIARDRLDGQRLRETLEKIAANMRRSGQILGTASHFIQERPGQRRRLDLEQAVREAWELLEDDARKHGVELQLRCGDPAIAVCMDPVHLSLVLSNLLRNCVEVLAGHGEQRQIELDIRQQQDLALIRIRDHGPGLPAVLLGQVGMPFRTAKPDGLGLGLAICATLLRCAAGGLELENHPEAGVIATVTLPVHNTQLPCCDEPFQTEPPARDR